MLLIGDSLSVVSTEENGVDIPSSFINQVVIKWESKVKDYEKYFQKSHFLF
ncbi:MAG: hypothetical protein CM15mP102_17050 [Flavobacteriales bacterium]|nr:MAG: hypothetical protein CM15mP102_17050 [Flavobacteriales bacterium]